MADFELEQLSDQDEFGLDGFDKVWIDPDTMECFPCSTSSGKTCRCCGENYLHWEKLDDNHTWRLFTEKGKIHNCPKRPLNNKT